MIAVFIAIESTFVISIIYSNAKSHEEILSHF